VNQIAAAAGFQIGPVVGGLLTTLSWRLVFLVNVPLGIAGTVWGLFRLREPVHLLAKQYFDWLGSLTFVFGLGSLLLAISLVAFPLISIIYVYLLLVYAVVGLAAFFIVEKRVSQPMLDFELFRNRLFFMHRQLDF